MHSTGCEAGQGVHQGGQDEERQHGGGGAGHRGVRLFQGASSIALSEHDYVMADIKKEVTDWEEDGREEEDEDTEEEGEEDEDVDGYEEEGEEEEGNLLLLHIWLGLATTVGCLIAGIITTSTSSEYFISRCFLSLALLFFRT